jgi:hypothetical protein
MYRGEVWLVNLDPTSIADVATKPLNQLALRNLVRLRLNPLTMLKLYIHKGEDYEQSICS